MISSPWCDEIIKIYSLFTTPSSSIISRLVQSVHRRRLHHAWRRQGKRCSLGNDVVVGIPLPPRYTHHRRRGRPCTMVSLNPDRILCCKIHLLLCRRLPCHHDPGTPAAVQDLSGIQIGLINWTEAQLAPMTRPRRSQQSDSAQRHHLTTQRLLPSRRDYHDIVMLMQNVHIPMRVRLPALVPACMKSMQTHDTGHRHDRSSRSSAVLDSSSAGPLQYSQAAPVATQKCDFV